MDPFDQMDIRLVLSYDLDFSPKCDRYFHCIVLQPAYLLENFLDFITSQCIMKTITQEDDQWEAFTLLVWTLGWFWSENTGQFVQHPVGWGIETLQVLLLTASHFDRLIKSDPV